MASNIKLFSWVFQDSFGIISEYLKFAQQHASVQVFDKAVVLKVKWNLTAQNLNCKCVCVFNVNLKNSCHVEIINHTFAVFGCFDLFISIIYWLISFGVAVYTHIIYEVTYPACRQNAELPKCTFNIKVFFSHTGIWTSCGARADSSNGQPDNTNSKRVQIDDPSSPPSSDPWHATEISKLSYWYQTLGS